MCLGCLRSTKTTIAARTMVHPAQSTATPFFTTSLHRTVGLQTNCTALLVRPSGARTRTSLGLGLFIMDNFTDCKCFPATRTARGRAQTSVPSTCCRLPTLTRLCVLSGLPLLRGQTRALSSLLPCQQRVCVRAVLFVLNRNNFMCRLCLQTRLRAIDGRVSRLQHWQVPWQQPHALLHRMSCRHLPEHDRQPAVPTLPA